MEKPRIMQQKILTKLIQKHLKFEKSEFTVLQCNCITKKTWDVMIWLTQSCTLNMGAGIRSPRSCIWNIVPLEEISSLTKF